MKKFWLAENQHGQQVSLRGKHPRKLLLAAVGGGKATKMYIDTPEGSKHAGYVIRGDWWRLYEIADTLNQLASEWTRKKEVHQMADIKIYRVGGSVIWYDKRTRSWWQCPAHAWDTAGANAGWPERNRPIIARVAGDMVRPADRPTRGKK